MLRPCFGCVFAERFRFKPKRPNRFRSPNRRRGFDRQNDARRRESTAKSRTHRRLRFGYARYFKQIGCENRFVHRQNLLPYLDEYFKTTKPAGTLFEPDYEALNAYKPQLIIIGSRAAKAFDKLNAIAPTIEMTADTANLKESAKERIDALAQIFGKQAEADKLKAEIDASFDAAKTAAQGKGKGLVILVNGGKMSAFGPSSRLGGWLHKDIGVPAVDEAIKEGSHGQPVSFEYLKEKIPTGCLSLTGALPSAKKDRRRKTC